MPNYSEDQDELIAAYIKTNIEPTLWGGCIHRVPDSLTCNRPSAYKYKKVSIGLFSSNKHDNEREAMEGHKQWHLYSFMAKHIAKGLKLKDIVKAMRDLEEDARKCYSEYIPITTRDFVKIMVYDGCFMLRLFHLWAKPAIEEDESIFKTWMIGSIRRDLILLENQIPYIVLECLFNRTSDAFQESFSLNELILKFFSPILPTSENLRLNGSVKPKHVLDLIRTALLPAGPRIMIADSPVRHNTHRVSDLLGSGVKFRKKAGSENLLHITFKNGVLEIPHFIFNDTTEDLLRNLVAYEQCDKNCTSQITSYVTLLDNLVNTSKDATVLRHEGIIANYLADDEEVSLAINKLSSSTQCRQFDYDGLCEEVNRYYNSDRNKWKALLKRDYLSSPWTIISVIAAIVLLLLTLTQTIFTILSYSPKKC